MKSDKNAFLDIVEDLGMLRKSPTDISFYRHPLAYLVEAADDICYTIIDFEDGINLGLIEEEFALEYMIKLVKDTIDIKKYHSLQHKTDRVSYLRALAIGVLINEAVAIFLDNEEAILKGEFHQSLLDASKYKAQINDIIKISVDKIYKSREVLEKEISGYKVLTTLLDVFTTAAENYKNGTENNLDRLVLNSFLKEIDFDGLTTYQALLKICSFVASMTDGNALRVFKKLEVGSM